SPTAAISAGAFSVPISTICAPPASPGNRWPKTTPDFAPSQRNRNALTALETLSARCRRQGFRGHFSMNFSDAYCGPPPLPSDLWLQWNFDPFATGLMAALFGAWLLAGRRDTTGRLALIGACGLIVIAFFSPICALTTALFSARVAHHVVLIGIVAPLLAIALPWRDGPLLPLAPLTILNALIVWIWHAPSAYEWAIYGAAPYWLMQLSLLASSWLFWREV